ncbi:MAG TPA: hypothetical protein VFL92_07350, partial [Sphingomonas sp.]|nr:hypothetical protein [Sphingomonas sp.]
IETIADVPARSLLSRLTDHYLQIIANRAPIGFEAEFVSQRGHNTLYRGILMPFSSDDETIDFVFGVINWKELAEEDFAAELVLEVSQALREAPTAPVWADGPRADLAFSDAGDEEDAAEAIAPEADIGLADRLAAARVLAEQAQGARLKSRAALYRALGLAYDFSLAAEARPEEYRELVEDAGLKVQRRAPMTAVVKLVFGAALDKARATEFAAALSHAHRCELPPGGFAAHIETRAGGLKAMVAAERAARRPATAPRPLAERARDALMRIEPRAMLDIPSDGGEFVLLLARREGDGRLAVLAPVPGDAPLVDRAIRKITR